MGVGFHTSPSRSRPFSSVPLPVSGVARKNRLSFLAARSHECSDQGAGPTYKCFWMLFSPEKRVANEFSMPQVSRYNNFISADRLTNGTALMMQALFVW